MKNKQTKPNTTLRGWCCLLFIRKSWPHTFVEVVSSQLLLMRCRLLQRRYIVLHTASYCCCSVSLSGYGCRNCPGPGAVCTSWFSPWCIKVLFSLHILSSARTWQWPVGTDLVLHRSGPPWAPVEGSPFSLLGSVKNVSSHLVLFFVEWRYSVQNRKKWEGRTVTSEETQQKLGSKSSSSVVSDAAATREPAQLRRRRMLLWRPRPEALN